MGRYLDASIVVNRMKDDPKDGAKDEPGRWWGVALNFQVDFLDA